MGGGMGGMGGGGGGFMNVPGDPRNRLDPRRAMDPRNRFLPDPAQIPGFQAFAVKDDLNLTPETVSPQKPRSEEIEPIDVRLPEGTSPADHWDAYFEKHKPEQGAVRLAVRDLMKSQQYGSVVAFIQTALRKSDPQPWMYEAMALAMQAGGHPKEDIERAVLSAADFCDNPTELLFLGVYMDQLGLDQRALHIYRQVSQLSPTSPEPYLHGLRLAERISDEAGIQWATIGILSQAWQSERQSVWMSGIRSSQAMLKKLRDENRQKEADAYEKALNEALVRDCVVKVTYTGNADVDILVEEPSGTICSHRSPRTTGGGVMGCDTSSSLASAGDCSEVYSCPKAFSGNYRMLLRRV